MEHLAVDGHGGVFLDVDFLLAVLVGADGGLLHLDLHGVATHDAALAPATGHEGGVGGHSATGGEDTVGGTHALDVLGVGLLADEDILDTGSLILLSLLAGEGDDTHGTTGACGQTFGENGVLLLVGGIQDGVQQLVELGGRYAHHHLAVVDEAFLQHVHSHGEGGDTGAFTHAALQHIELAVLDGELDVEHIVVVLLEDAADVAEFLIGLGHQLLHRVHVLVLLVLGVVVEGVGGADTGNDILALGVDEPLAVELVVAGGGVAGESDAGGGSVTHVAEDHSLDVDGGAPIVGNTLNLAVADGLLAVPALEDGLDATFHLGAGVVGELGAEHLFHTDLESVGQFHQVLGGELGVALIAFEVLVLVEHVVELFADTLAVGGLDALGFLHDDVGIHHDKTTVAVIHEAGVVGLLEHAGDGLAGETDVEDGVHHAGHGGAGAGTAADEQGVLGVVILHTHDLLDILDTFPHLFHQTLGKLAVVGVVGGAALGGDGETGRHGKAQQAHLGEVGTLAAQEVLHVGFSFGSLAAERVNVLCHLNKMLVINYLLIFHDKIENAKIQNYLKIL